MDAAFDESGLNANGLTPEEQATFDNLYGTNPGAAEAPKPGFFARTWAGVAGIPSGLARLGSQGVTTFGAAVSAVNRVANQPVQLLQAAERVQAAKIASTDPDEASRLVADSASYAELSDAGPEIRAFGTRLGQESEEFYRPDPATTGTAGNILFGALDSATRIGVGSLLTGGRYGVEVAAGSMGMQRTQDLIAQGVDTKTALESGAIQAGSFEAMGAFGGEGGTLAQRVLKSAAINTGAGLANRALDSAVLDAAGYNKLAEQQQWNDAQSIISDAVIGMAFPLVHAAGARLVDASATRSETKLADKITQNPELFDRLRMPDGNVSQFSIEAALTSLNAQHARDVAPGVPTDIRSQSLHLKALDAAIQQTMRGDPVQVEPIVRDMDTIPRPAPESKEAGLSEGVNEFENVIIADVDGMLKRGEINENIAEQMRRFINGEEQPERTGAQDVAAEAYFATVGGNVPEPGWADSTVARNDAGQPATLYRGSRNGETTAEDFAQLGAATGHPSAHLGLFLTDDSGEASRYGKVGEHHVDLRNPKVYDAAEFPAIDDAEAAIALRNKLIAEGHDGIIMDATPYGGSKSYIVFKPEQVITRRERAEDAGAAEQAQAPRRPVSEVTTDVDPHHAAKGPGREPADGFARNVEVNAASVANANPNMEVVLEDGTTTTAAEALKQADDTVIQAEADAHGFEAAALCAARYNDAI